MPEHKTEDQQTPEVLVGELPIRRSPHYRSMFANSMNLITSHMDVRLNLGEVGPDENGTIINEQVGSVLMSWEHAKALAAILVKNVRDHEQKFGPLYLVPKQELKEHAENQPKPAIQG